MTTNNSGSTVATTEGFETVIGLEVHIELATDTKLFSGAPTEATAPNTVDGHTLGLPGTLPVLNEHAVELAVKLGLALGCEIMPFRFDRKAYFYADQPKGYQITQEAHPVCRNGEIVLSTGTLVHIERAHLEEDAAKLVHDPSGALVDHNRCGTPLLEVVTAPDMRTADEAAEFIELLREIAVAVGATDGKLEEGSMRADCNVSVRRPGEPLGARCEVKNLNSLRSIKAAITLEAERHIAAITAGDRVEAETRRYDAATSTTASMRSKEDVGDYRYFPDPDLVMCELDPSYVARLEAGLPELPELRRQRLIAAGATPTQAKLLVSRGTDTLCMDTVSTGADPVAVFTHAEHGLGEAPLLDAGGFAQALDPANGLSSTHRRAVISQMGATGVSFAGAVSHLPEAADNLDEIVDELVAAHPTEWVRLCAGEQKLTGFFVGRARATHPGLDPAQLTHVLNERAR